MTRDRVGPIVGRGFAWVEFFVSVAVAACGGDPEIAEGEALYEANCEMCHGQEALGGGPMAASLPVQPPSILEHLGHHTQAQLLGLIRDGIPPAMPPAPLTEDEIRLVIDYVWTLVPESQVAALRAMRDQMEAAAHGSPPAAQPNGP
jgi:mono/diheme cytochrome c family protein